MYVYEYIVIDIVHAIEEKTSISVAKKGRIGSSSEYCTRYRFFSSRYRSHDLDIGGSKEGRIGDSSEYRILYRSCFLQNRSHDFDIEVYKFRYWEIFEKWLRYRSQKLVYRSGRWGPLSKCKLATWACMQCQQYYCPLISYPISYPCFKSIHFVFRNQVHQCSELSIDK